MLPRHRRRPYLVQGSTQPRSAVLIRVVGGLIILLIVWYAASKAISFFDQSAGRKSATLLQLRTPEGVQVSLQGEEWQRAETNLKLYASDAVVTRGSSDATLQFFDGSRARLDIGTDVLIEQADYQVGGVSALKINIRSGRIWLMTPANASFSGSILRTVKTVNYEAEVPAGSEILLSSSLINVMRAAGVGVKATLAFGETPSLYVGEGQYFPISEQTKRLIESGEDPYEIRDPVTLELLKDPFLVSSLSVESAPSGGTSSSAPSAGTPSDQEPLVVVSPQNQAQVNSKSVTVTGKVSPRIVQVRVNGQTVTIKTDRTFSVDMNMPLTPTVVITVEATDQQGIPLGKIERTVVNTFQIVVEPVRIKSPVASGGTLTTALQEVEITGEAPTGTAGVEVNDYRLQLFKPGAKTWSYLASTQLLNLKLGENIYVVRAVDQADNKSQPRSITIVLTSEAATGTGVTAQPPLKQNPPLTPGVLVVDKPATGTTVDTSEKEIVIEGRTSDATASISINGYTLSLYQAGKTTWNYIASTEMGTMKRGKNVYRIVARNANGEILDVVEYTINFKP